MYPTKEQILEKEVMFKKPVIETIYEWKKQYFVDGIWRNMSNNEKNKSLKKLIFKIVDKYTIFPQTNPTKVEIQKNKDPCCEINGITGVNTIFLDQNKPSIISTLHELAHALFGESELKACRWSIWLFKKTFPKSYEDLKWDKHMLIKR